METKYFSSADVTSLQYPLDVIDQTAFITIQNINEAKTILGFCSDP